MMLGEMPPEAIREVGLTIRARSYGGETWTYEFPVVLLDSHSGQLDVKMLPDESELSIRAEYADRVARPVPQRLYVRLDGGLLVPNVAGQTAKITRED